MSGFRVSSLTVGTGTLGICPIPGGAGDYSGDIAAILRWRPDVVFTMTSASELRSVGADRIGGDLSRLGIRWQHLPIKDFGAPETATAALWPAAARAARAALGDGGRVLVHCYGGCGRSGMAALRLMVELGEPAQVALQRLRSARPCAVETEAQMAWALGPAAQTPDSQA